MSDLKLPYTGEKLLELLGNIKTEEELKAFIKQYSSGGHTDEQIRIIVAEWYQENKDTPVTKADVDGWIEEYLAENPVSGGLTEQQVNEIVAAYIQDSGISGSVSEEEIAQAVESYIAEHQITSIGSVNLYYKFNNDIPSNGDGEIQLFTSDINCIGDYEIYWSNSDGIMDNYSAINTMKLTATFADKISYDKLIVQNAIPKYATGIVAVKDGVIKAKYTLPTEKLWSDDVYGEHLYSFGAISDVHYQYDTGAADFAAAMTYLDEKENVVAVCCAGDLTNSGSTTELQQIKNAIDTYTTPFYTCNGNHECASSGYEDRWSIITDNGPYFLKEIEGDIFIFININSFTSKVLTLFTSESLDWLERTLEQYRNQRVFLFEHAFPYDYNGFANPNNVYGLNIWGTESDRVRFMDIIKHYSNVIWFSGHSHIKYYLQEEELNCNVMKLNEGATLVHISSLTAPRDIEGNTITGYIYAQSEGTVVDVYPNHIILRSRNFVDEKFIGVAQYILDTTPVTIDANPDLATVYSITNNLTNVSTTNSAESVAENESYSSVVSANDGYILESVTVTMGGTDITSSAYSDGNITIDAVTGDVVITANATPDENTIPCEGIELNTTSISFDAQGSTQTLTATLTPSNTTDGLVWNSSDQSVATVDNGVVTSVGSGTATITCNCGTKSANCEVTVEIPQDVTVLAQLDLDYTFTGRNTSAYVSESFTIPANTKIYAKWDKLEYSGGTESDAKTQKIGIAGLNSGNGFLTSDYADYSNETLLTTGFSAEAERTFGVKSSSSSTATFPATWKVTNFRIYYYNE